MKRRMIFNWFGLSFLFLLMELLKLFEDKNEISILISNEGKQALIVLITTPIIEIRKLVWIDEFNRSKKNMKIPHTTIQYKIKKVKFEVTDISSKHLFNFS